MLRVDDYATIAYPWVNVWVADFFNHYDKDTHTYYGVSGYAADENEIIQYIGNEDIL